MYQALSFLMHMSFSHPKLTRPAGRGRLSTTGFAMSAVRNTLDFGLERDEECVVRRPILMSAIKREGSDLLYLAFLAVMHPTLREIDETEPTSTSTYYIPGFEVFMHHSNIMKVLHQLVYLSSAGNHIPSIQEQLFRYELPLLTTLKSLTCPMHSDCRHINQG